MDTPLHNYDDERHLSRSSLAGTFSASRSVNLFFKITKDRSSKPLTRLHMFGEVGNLDF
jgi:hypothetical protein